MKFKNSRKYSAVVILAVLSLTGIYNACADLGGFNAVRSVASASGATVLGAGAVSPGAAIPLSALTFNQVLRSSLSLTNVTLNGTINDTYNKVAPVMLATSDISQVNSPMWIAVTSVNGEVCNSLMNTEFAAAAGARKFIVNPSTGANIDMSGSASSVSSADFETAMNNFALYSWGRSLSQTEINTVSSAQSAFVSAESSSPTNSALTLMIYGCTAMLSSLESISL